MTVILNTQTAQQIVRSKDQPDHLQFLTLQPGKNELSKEDVALVQADLWGAHLIEEGLLDIGK